jgi:hypothetical protein
MGPFVAHFVEDRLGHRSAVSETGTVGPKFPGSRRPKPPAGFVGIGNLPKGRRFTGAVPQWSLGHFPRGGVTRHLVPSAPPSESEWQNSSWASIFQRTGVFLQRPLGPNASAPLQPRWRRPTPDSKLDLPIPARWPPPFQLAPSERRQLSPSPTAPSPTALRAAPTESDGAKSDGHPSGAKSDGAMPDGPPSGAKSPRLMGLCRGHWSAVWL